MDRLKFLLCVGILFAVATTPLARAQYDLERYKTQEPDPKQEKAKEKKQKQAKVKNTDEGHRKHWYSLPHFRHKKQESAHNARQTAPNSNTRTAALKPVKATTAAKPANKTAMSKGQASKTASKPGQTTHAKTAQVAKPGTRKTAARSAQSRTAAGSTSNRKTIATANHGKAVRHDCSEQEAKKGECGKTSN